MTTPDYFDLAAPTWDKHTPPSPIVMTLLTDLLHLHTGADVLDIGTGTGILIPLLRQRIGNEGSITAVDRSEGMLAEAKRKYSNMPNTHFLHQDIEALLPPSTYDAISLYSVYPHLQRPVETIYRLYTHALRRGGTLLIAHSDSRHFINAIHCRHQHEIYSQPLPPAEEIAAQLQQRGITNTLYADTDRFYFIVIYRLT